MSNEETKKCKHCQSDIPKKATVCPVCKKKQGGGCLSTVLTAIVVFVIIIIIASSGGDKEPKVKKSDDVSNETSQEQSSEETVSNRFNVGETAETKDLKITFVSASPYTSSNEFLQPKDGYEYWEFELKFENISDTDQAVSSMMDWECYADNSKVDQTFIGDDNGLDAKLSSGRSTQGKVYFEVPEDAKSIELEYDINFWQSDKIVFVAK